jgi:hypothetical protein
MKTKLITHLVAFAFGLLLMWGVLEIQGNRKIDNLNRLLLQYQTEASYEKGKADKLANLRAKDSTALINSYQKYDSLLQRLKTIPKHVRSVKTQSENQDWYDDKENSKYWKK